MNSCLNVARARTDDRSEDHESAARRGDDTDEGQRLVAVRSLVTSDANEPLYFGRRVVQVYCRI